MSGAADLEVDVGWEKFVNVLVAVLVMAVVVTGRPTAENGEGEIVFDVMEPPSASVKLLLLLSRNADENWSSMIDSAELRKARVGG